MCSRTHATGKLADVTGQLGGLREEVHGLTDRFDRFLVNAGSDMRLVIRRLDRLEDHAGLGPL